MIVGSSAFYGRIVQRLQFSNTNFHTLDPSNLLAVASNVTGVGKKSEKMQIFDQ